MGQGMVALHCPEVSEGAPLNVERLLDVVLGKFGVDVNIDELPPGIEGIAQPPNLLTIPPQVYDNLHSDGRARFTGSHEATHALMHLRQLTQRLVSTGAERRLHRRSEIPVFRDPEWQANRGAAALLMPYRDVWQMINQGRDSTVEIARRFNVSLQAASYRLDDARSGRLRKDKMA